MIDRVQNASLVSKALATTTATATDSGNNNRNNIKNNRGTLNKRA